MIRVTRIGWKARRALARTGARRTVVAALSRSIYLEVDGDLVWLGPVDSTLHARAILAEGVPTAAPGRPLATPIDVGAAREWRPPAPPRAAEPATIDAGCRGLVAAVERVGTPEGFGALLAGRRPPFPLDHAARDARAFLEACAGDDARAATAFGARLIGLGPGLTPAGDDLVGAALFGRRWLGALGLADPAGWAHAADALRSLAARRTTHISAVLLGDLLAGDAYAPLHELAAGLTAGAPREDAVAAARRLARIGHSSGWDMLTGFLGGLSPLPHDGASSLG
jgi:hypothetical protein